MNAHPTSNHEDAPVAGSDGPPEPDAVPLPLPPLVPEIEVLEPVPAEVEVVDPDTVVVVDEPAAVVVVVSLPAAVLMPRRSSAKAA